MNVARPLFPRPLTRLLAALPQYPHAVLFAGVLNRLVTPQVRNRDLAPLHGKHLCIRVQDAGIEFHFSVGRGGFVARPRRGAPDVTIAAAARDFLLLALRREDPDTLFFNRRLVMEGDTELGLLLKNTLDAVEWPLLARLFHRVAA